MKRKTPRNKSPNAAGATRSGAGAETKPGNAGGAQPGSLTEEGDRGRTKIQYDSQTLFRMCSESSP